MARLDPAPCIWGKDFVVATVHAIARAQLGTLHARFRWGREFIATGSRSADK